MKALLNDYVEQKKAEEKANSDRGLGTLLNMLVGGVTGFITGGGPVGAVIGAGGGLLKSFGGPAVDTKSAMDKFNAWKNGQYTPETPTYDSNTGWNSYYGPGRM